MNGELTRELLYEIEKAARGLAKDRPRPFAHPNDTLMLAAEVRRLWAENYELRRTLCDGTGDRKSA